MDKKQAQILIEDTFNDSFNEERFAIFAKNLLNDLEPKSNSYSGNYIWDDYKEHINTYKRIGKYIDPEDEALDVLIVEVKSVTKLERARTALRNFAIKHLKKFDKNYALVAFYSKEDDGADWRFSFIKLDYSSFFDEEKKKVKIKEEIVPAKRYSFLVGKYEKAHTAKNQLLPLLQNISNNPTIEELEAAFSIEKVTDEFFNQYKDLYIKLFEHFENDSRVKAELDKAGIDNARFTKKLLGQIVFLYFLQKKGWLGVAKNERWGTGKKRFVQELYEQAQTESVNFFKDKLQYLFYDALAKERDNVNSYYKHFDCRIPFLNGGLFEADYHWETANITIPETLFRNEEKNKAGDIGTGALDVFDRYNFTIKEDEPLDKEVAVDPEMLGKVFENMLDITERKSKGAFYTPREIVHYMCQESLIHYLDNALNSGTISYQELGSDQAKLFGGSTDKKGNLKIEIEHNDNVRVPKAAIETYIREGHFALENDERVAAKGETKTYKYQLPESIRQNADLIDQKLSDIRICDPAIGSGAFPVGLLHELVNAMLVLKPHFSDNYLSKKLKDFSIHLKEPVLSEVEVSYSESRYIYRLKRHIIQESIYGVDIDASAIDIARLRLWLSLVVDEDDLDPIETLPNLDYKIVCGNSLIGLPDGAMRNLQVEAELEILKEEFYNITEDAKKKALRHKINTKIRELLDSAEQFAGYKIDFDFKLFFSEVWREKGGFDVVIGNPPYGASLDKTQKIIVSKTFELKSSETAILFIEKAFSIFNQKGAHSYIIPKPFTYSSNYSKARLFVKNALQEIIDCGKAFDNVKFEAVIIVNNVNSSINYYSNKVFTKDKTFKNLANIAKDSLKIFGFYLNGVEQNETKIANSVLQKSDTIGNHSNNTRGGMLQSHILQDGSYPVIGGKEISRYGIKNFKGFLKSRENIDNNAILNKGSILVQNIVAHITKPIDQIKIIGCIPKNETVLILDTINQITPSSDKLTNYLLWHLFHSEFINWYCYRFIFGKAIRTMHFDNTVTNRIPLPFQTIEKHKNVNVISEILYHYILHSKEKNDLNSLFFHSLADSIIYELYFPEEIKSAGKEILKHLGDLPNGQAGLKPITDDMSKEEKLAIIQSEFERLYDPNHPVRFAMETLDSVEEVRIIKEALK